MGLFGCLGCKVRNGLEGEEVWVQSQKAFIGEQPFRPLGPCACRLDVLSKGPCGSTFRTVGPFVLSSVAAQKASWESALRLVGPGGKSSGALLGLGSLACLFSLVRPQAFFSPCFLRTL
ncbi:hypothetical protein OIU77_022130, partial [Salix suchowensis]